MGRLAIGEIKFGNAYTRYIIIPKIGVNLIRISIASAFFWILLFCWLIVIELFMIKRSSVKQ